MNGHWKIPRMMAPVMPWIAATAAHSEKSVPMSD
jgi:hypothetical protein